MLVFAYLVLELVRCNGIEPSDKFLEGALLLEFDWLDTLDYDRIGVGAPLFQKQWHLHNNLGLGGDLNVTGVWAMGITGANVTVAIVDDGLSYNHPDFAGKYVAEASYNFVDDVPDPEPTCVHDDHGTKCAGIVAAGSNRRCGVGIAYNARVSGLKVNGRNKRGSIGGEAKALVYKGDVNDIYSCSWGPRDDGSDLTSIAPDIVKALETGVTEGRHGKGSIYVFSSGNGGDDVDFCSFSGYANAIQTIVVGSIDHHDRHPLYSETCSSLMISAYSSLDGFNTIPTSSNNNHCEDFGGTSAAAAAVSGVLALVLESRPELTWRDIQHLLIRSAALPNFIDDSWSTTYAGRNYSSKFGYGRIDAYASVTMASTFPLVRPQTSLTSGIIPLNQSIPKEVQYRAGFTVTHQMKKEASMDLLEHVTVNLNLLHPRRSNLEISILSPNLIKSPLVFQRPKDNSTSGYENLTVMSLKHWDEPILGTWQLLIFDHSSQTHQGLIVSWEIKFYGQINPNEQIPHPSEMNYEDPKTINSTMLVTRVTHNSIPSQGRHELPSERHLMQSFLNPNPTRFKPLNSNPHIQPEPHTSSPSDLNPGTVKSSTLQPPPHLKTEPLLQVEKSTLILIVGVTLLSSLTLASIIVLYYASVDDRYTEL